MRTSRTIRLAGALVLALLQSSALAQEPASRNVAVKTNLDGAILYADSARVGVVGESYMPVPATARSLKLVAPSQAVWGISPVTADLDEAPDSLVVEMLFRYHHQVESSPHGAEVYLESDGTETRYLGSTPVLFVDAEAIEGLFRLELDGYTTEKARLGGNVWNRYQVPLRPIARSGSQAADVYWKQPKKRRRWIDYTALGAAAAGGLLAVHFKFKADRRFEEYQETGNPDLRPGIKRYDTYSGVSLGVMQAGIGIFAIRLVLK